MSEAFKTDVYKLVSENIQAPHPDWLAEREEYRQKVIASAPNADDSGEVISFATYVSRNRM